MLRASGTSAEKHSEVREGREVVLLLRSRQLEGRCGRRLRVAVGVLVVVMVAAEN
jgi:hypothetical protein